MPRAGFWDALAHGCVNVVFGTGDPAAPGPHYADDLFGDHRHYTVTIPMNVWQAGQTLEMLRSISSAQVFELQHAHAARRRSAYSVNGNGTCEDATLVVAKGLRQRFAAMF